MPSPLEDIENRKGQQDIGVLLFRVYEGARGEGASRVDAFIVLVAYCRGMFGAQNDPYPDEEEEGKT